MSDSKRSVIKPYRQPLGDKLWRNFVIGVPYFWLVLFFLAPFAIVLKISFATPIVALPFRSISSLFFCVSTPCPTGRPSRNPSRRSRPPSSRSTRPPPGPLRLVLGCFLPASGPRFPRTDLLILLWGFNPSPQAGVHVPRCSGHFRAGRVVGCGDGLDHVRPRCAVGLASDAC